METFKPTLCLIILILCIVLFGATGHCSTNLPGIHPDGVVAFQQNPYIYLYGQITGGQVVRQNHVEFTWLTFQPAYTILQQSVLFCGNQSKDFNGKLGPLVVTYARRGTGDMYNGMACHELESVAPVPTSDTP